MQPNGEYENLTPQQVKARLDAGEQLLLLDVREPHEYALSKISPAQGWATQPVLKPLSQAQLWAYDLPKDQPIILFCHHGMRSAQVAQALSAQLGHTNVANMLGGIEEWSLQVDPQVPRY
jgi:rhodanese-related sulfurtransferase